MIIPHNAPPSDELEFVVKSEIHPLIPEGIYQANYIRHEEGRYSGGKKLYVYFEIIEGPHQGVRLFRCYNRPDPLKRGCDLFKDLVLLYGKRPSKATRLPMKLFAGRVLEIGVRTVKKDRKQNPLAEHQQYSVVDRIVRVLAGGANEN